MKIHKSMIIILLGCLILTSCTIEKRLYTTGYHVEFKRSNSSEPRTQGNVDKFIAFTNTNSTPSDCNKNYTVNESPKDNAVKAIVLDAIIKPGSRKSISSEKVSANTSNFFVKNKLRKVSPSKKWYTQKKKSTGNTAVAGKSWLVCLLLCIFLGPLGIHRFYYGYTGLGVLYLFTAGLFGIGWLIDIILLIIPGGLLPKDRK